MKLDEARLAVIGLGYVGLPLAVEFGKQRGVLAFDQNDGRIADLIAGEDVTGEVSPDDIALAGGTRFSSRLEDLAACNVFIVCVPTPVTASKQPDLSPLERACETIGARMPKGSVVIFESTVFPGCTEEVCVPILERHSGLVFNRDFFCGYSPERINPGDPVHKLVNIVKVTSGSTPEIADLVDELYRSIITAGTHRASSIKVAEAAKVIENTQRDLNIALMNELSIIFSRLSIDTKEVLEAAGTKWNFLPFKPGLVGGHCIGVDPYYLTFKAEQVGYYPEVILAGRRINDAVGGHIASQVLDLMAARGIDAATAKVLVLGLAFKENCRDLRNSKVIDIIRNLTDVARVDVHDPLVSAKDARREYAIGLLPQLPAEPSYDCVILAVAHDEFSALGAPYFRALLRPNGILFDVKSVFAAGESDGRL